ncbi:cation diffusion facilitator family transporter [Rhizobium mongolense]|uniref:Cation diffusion facilitator family transporter n=2 Tax=Rhizobium mongolense TaxID=57676 RepID=A0ABR6IFC5_9HYPH|nr:cation diffusion facilitator family transporter [Rhizobium mongolense]MBB4226510.1 cation diffusion facilitator family transporter [Rhizobium mongolense]TVZ73778.1 cation diffusion facilitator family transporter [Rhizobium mongolense USDA 1844]
MAAQSGSTRVIYAALLGNLLIALTKFTAALVTGSSVMLSEGIHSVVDTGNEMLLLYGLHRSARPPDENHPLGHGREIYFWSFIVALLVFAAGAGLSFYEGIAHILRPEPARNIMVNYIVIGISALFEGVAWSMALRHFRREKGKLGYLTAVRRSKDPTVFTVLFEDTAALLGLLIAFVAITAAELLEMPQLDGLGSMGIGVVLATTAIFLARECKGLLIGEQALPSVRRRISEIASEDPDVVRVNDILTVHLGPDDIIATLSIEFRDELTTPLLETCVLRIEKKIIAELPQVSSVFVRPQAPLDLRQEAPLNLNET